MAGMNGNGSKKPRKRARYKSYLFVERDPIIEAMRGVFSENKVKYSAVTKAGGPTTTTLRNWFRGQTRRPQFCTVAATIRSLDKAGIRFSANGKPYLVD